MFEGRKTTNVRNWQMDVMTLTTTHEATRATQTSPNGKEQADQHHSLPLPLPHSGCQESLVLQEVLPRACAFRCLLSDTHILASVSVSPTAANRSFLLPSTYPSLTKLLASGNREQLPSVGTFSSNHPTLQSSKPNPFSSCNNLLKGPSRHTAHLYSLTLAP